MASTTSSAVAPARMRVWISRGDTCCAGTSSAASAPGRVEAPNRGRPTAARAAASREPPDAAVSDEAEEGAVVVPEESSGDAEEESAAEEASRSWSERSRPSPASSAEAARSSSAAGESEPESPATRERTSSVSGRVCSPPSWSVSRRAVPSSVSPAGRISAMGASAFLRVVSVITCAAAARDPSGPPGRWRARARSSSDPRTRHRCDRRNRPPVDRHLATGRRWCTIYAQRRRAVSPSSGRRSPT